jgi:uncharacterized protein YukE
MNSEFITNIFNHFFIKIQKIYDEGLKNFKEKISEVDKLVYEFFETEMSRVDSATNDIIKLLENLRSVIKKIISLYQEKFIDKFEKTQKEYDTFAEEISNRKLYI